MARKNRTTYAILGMLSLGEKSGYDLKKEFEERMSHFWAESLGQIYPALHRLHREGLVASRRRTRSGRPERTAYRITRAGRRELAGWLAETPGREQVRNELLLKLFFGPETGVETSLAHLESFEQLQQSSADAYGAMEREIERQAAPEETKLFWRLTLLSGKRVTEARLEWCREAKRALREHLDSRPGAHGGPQRRVTK